MDFGWRLFKELSPVELAVIFHRVYERYYRAAERILKVLKCKRCGWCCRTCPPTLSIQEVATISRRLKVTQAEFLGNYCTVEVDGNSVKIALKTPCPFLKGRSRPRCSIYDIRPIPCRFYPFNLNFPAIFNVDKCGLAKEISDYIERNTPKDREEFKKIWEKYHQDPLDKAIARIITHLWGTKPWESEATLKMLKSTLNSLYGSPREGEETEVLYVHIVILEYVADRLEAESASRFDATASKNREDTLKSQKDHG